VCFRRLTFSFSCQDYLAIPVGNPCIKKTFLVVRNTSFHHLLNAASLPESGCKESVFFLLPPNVFLFFFDINIQVPDRLAPFISKKYLNDVARPAVKGKTASGNDGM